MKSISTRGVIERCRRCGWELSVIRGLPGSTYHPPKCPTRDCPGGDWERIPPDDDPPPLRAA